MRQRSRRGGLFPRSISANNNQNYSEFLLKEIGKTSFHAKECKAYQVWRNQPIVFLGAFARQMSNGFCSTFEKVESERSR
jgi:hypothetical protein